MNKEITFHNSSELQNSTITDRFGRVFNYAFEGTTISWLYLPGHEGTKFRPYSCTSHCIIISSVNNLQWFN